MATNMKIGDIKKSKKRKRKIKQTKMSWLTGMSGECKTGIIKQPEKNIKKVQQILFGTQKCHNWKWDKLYESIKFEKAQREQKKNTKQNN